MTELERFRIALEDIASAQMRWYGDVGPLSRDQLNEFNDFIDQLQEIASEALKQQPGDKT